MAKAYACGNPDCCASSGIHGDDDNYWGLTFGSGNCDNYGYWENPCAVCARAAELRSPAQAPCWPFPSDPIERARLEQLGADARKLLPSRWTSTPTKEANA